jgi:hypothetical protein
LKPFVFTSFCPRASAFSVAIEESPKPVTAFISDSSEEFVGKLRFGQFAK